MWSFLHYLNIVAICTKAIYIVYLGVPWITPQRNAIQKAFKNHIRDGKLPSFDECRGAIAQYSPLRKRTVQVVKAHVQNEIKRRRIF